MTSLHSTVSLELAFKLITSIKLKLVCFTEINDKSIKQIMPKGIKRGKSPKKGDENQNEEVTNVNDDIYLRRGRSNKSAVATEQLQCKQTKKRKNHTKVDYLDKEQDQEITFNYKRKGANNNATIFQAKRQRRNGDGNTIAGSNQDENLIELIGDGVLLSVDGMDEAFLDETPTANDTEVEDDESIAESDSEEVNASMPLGITAGTTSTSNLDEMDAAEILARTPKLKDLFNQMLDEKLEEKFKKFQEQKDEHEAGEYTPKKVSQINQTPRRLVKSLSDTTLYTPAMNRFNKDINDFSNLKQQKTPEVTPGKADNNGSINKVSTERLDLLEKISDFVESMRLEHEENERKDGNNMPEGFSVAKDRAERTILEAEKFRAQVETPPGRNAVINNLKGRITQEGMSDNDFFHLTCHIDGSLQEKIEKDEYVNLEKLLPRGKAGTGSAAPAEGRLEWIVHDGATYLAPVTNKDSKITGVRKWEQAFRIYATIYCGANPNRSKEIWQYMSVINSAASAYSWDNVASYDYTFRHLMEFNPCRSWAITYNQMWNLCMRDPLPKAFASKFTGNHNNVGNHQNPLPAKGRRNKSDYCWSFNKGVVCKFGKKCKFIERCSYCDSGAHGVNVCPKLERKDGSHSQLRNSPLKKKDNGSILKKQKKNTYLTITLLT